MRGRVGAGPNPLQHLVEAQLPELPRLPKTTQDTMK